MPRKAENTPRIAILKRATRDAVEAIGGLDLASGETAIGRSQLGRCQSRTETDTLSLRDAITLDELSMSRGGPFLLTAYARLLNHAVVELPDVEIATADLATSVVNLAVELGDLSRCISEAMADGKVEEKEARRALDELHQLNQLSARLRLQLIALANGGR